jgi:hypothetical protein
MKRLIVLLLLAFPLSAQTTHKVVITWNDTVNPSGTTYNIYKASTACTGTPTFVKLTSTPITAMTYTDSGVPAGTYCYYATAVGPGGESAQSNTGTASVVGAPNAITITVTVN